MRRRLPSVYRAAPLGGESVRRSRHFAMRSLPSTTHWAVRSEKRIGDDAVAPSRSEQWLAGQSQIGGPARACDVLPRMEYEAHGIRWYWLLDSTLGSLEVFELSDGGKYTKVLAATEGKVDAVPGCSGLVVDLDDLWAELDRLG
ncbi:MAG: Uma2 family endonuclease [Polyangiaceae bacterium]|nr:Uma2 family endonuclease [Polyangiaceae bacterium]